MTQTNERTPGQVLRALRAEKRKTQVAFGREMRWRESVQKNLENGVTKFTDEHLGVLIDKWMVEEGDEWWQKFRLSMDYEGQLESDRILSTLPRIKPTPEQSDKGAEVIPFCLQRHQIAAHVHDEYAIELDDEMREELANLNKRRRTLGRRDYFPSTCYRLIQPPKFGETGMVLHLTPCNFACTIIEGDPEASLSAKEHVTQKIEAVARTIPEDQQSGHPVMNANSYHALGTAIALVTSDGKILLRRRGKDVLFGREKWDVSCSGYCTYRDRTPGGELDIEHTVIHEVQQELGVVTADNEEIVFTGLFIEYQYSAELVLAYWPLEATADELIRLITDKQPESAVVFDTTKRAREPWVWDGKNLIVDFDATAIAQAMKAVTEEGGRATLTPGAYACLQRSLEINGRSTEGLDGLLD